MTATLHKLAVAGQPAVGGGPRQLAWWEWNATGQAAPRRVVVCVHGLTRQARDFDVLAQALSPHALVVSVDVAGRGHSDWLQDPNAYAIPTYAADMAQLLFHLRQRLQEQGLREDAQIDWVGTSMGGLIGLALASQPALGLRRVVLNDVGPVIEPASLRRIATYVGQPLRFPSEQAAAAYLLTISQGFGPHTPEQWLALTRPMLRPADDAGTPSGQLRLHYDPAIATPFKAMLTLPDEVAQKAAADGEAQLWALYDAITAPTLLVRGAESDLLSRETARHMTQRGPRARLVELPGVGHAPTLVAPDQIAAVAGFLLEP
jgi:pimeloyl-ACP methyl ester carboxylesterase